jgi:hypothetical protein
MFLEVFIPAGVLSPIPGDEAKPQTYFTCRKDHDTPVDAGEVARLLRRRTQTAQRRRENHGKANQETATTATPSQE